MSTLDRKTFTETYNISEEDIAKSGMEWSSLEAIFDDHVARAADLQLTAAYIADRLRHVENVHSLKYRIKDAAHVMEKVIRKRCAEPPADITADNYRERVTDLVGVRALHLFKEEWPMIHDQIVGAWDLFERPVANVRKGDPDDLAKMFAEKGCDINEHPFGYRSVHYIVKSQPSKDVVLAEIQVRTIFEEGWSEIDHRIRYPYNLDNILLSQFLVMFNRLAGSADEMGSFIRFLKRELDARELEQVTTTAAYEKLAQELKQQIETLEITRKQKQELEGRVKQLTEAVREKVAAEPGAHRFAIGDLATRAYATNALTIIQHNTTRHALADARRKVIESDYSTKLRQAMDQVINAEIGAVQSPKKPKK